MTQQIFLEMGSQDRAFTVDRTRLVKLCTALTHNAEAAEDLAQETLLEAWRHLQDLREPERFQQWLAGIARNVCLRWSRKQGKELARNTEFRLYSDEKTVGLDDMLVDDYDIEIELERKELIELLDRSLALLPVETRNILIDRYVKESPLSEVADRLGINRDAVAMRLQRGKLALRRLLLSETDQVSSLGMQQQYIWTPTRIWCFHCAQHKIQVSQFDPQAGTLHLRCPGCDLRSDTTLTHTSEKQLFAGIKGVKPAIGRLSQWVNRFYLFEHKLATALCIRCGHSTVSQQSIEEDNTSPFNLHPPGFINQCKHCQLTNWTSLDFMIFARPEVQRFWKEHPRLQILPQQELEVDGSPALLTGVESVIDEARLDVITTADTFQVLKIYGDRV